MKKIYVGCSLTQAPESFRSMVEKLKSELRKEYEALDFLGLEKREPGDVYAEDIQKNIVACDVFVAIVDYPAIGLGYEMATALEKYSKPTLALAHTDAHLSRLVLGIDHPMYTFKRYQGLEDMLSAVKEKMERHFKPTPVQSLSETNACDVCIA